MRVRAVLSLFAMLAVATAAEASAQSKPKYVQTGVPRALKDIEGELKKLTKKDSKDAAKRYDAFMTFLGLSSPCPAGDCSTVTATQWHTANLDGDSDDERVLTIATVGTGTCPSARMQVLVFKSTAKGWTVRDQTSVRLAGATKPLLQLTTAAVHDKKLHDLVIRADGQCASGAREHEVHIETFEHGRLERIMSSADHTTALVSHALVGAAPAVIELTHTSGGANGKVKLWYDDDSGGYDALRPYDEVLKHSVSKDDDESLSPKECAAPLGSTLVTDCHLEGQAKLQVAVQHGKALGLTLTLTPESRYVARCLRARIASETWKNVPAMSGCVRTFAVK